MTEEVKEYSGLAMPDGPGCQPTASAADASSRSGIPIAGFDPARVRRWLAAMAKQGEDRVWRGAEQAALYVAALEAERDAYRTQAINRGWNWRMCDAYGRTEYERHLANEIDLTAGNMLGRPPIAEMFASRAAQGMDTRQGGDGTAPSRSDDSPVRQDAPDPIPHTQGP